MMRFILCALFSVALLAQNNLVRKSSQRGRRTSVTEENARLKEVNSALRQLASEAAVAEPFEDVAVAYGLGQNVAGLGHFAGFLKEYFVVGRLWSGCCTKVAAAAFGAGVIEMPSTADQEVGQFPSLVNCGGHRKAFLCSECNDEWGSCGGDCQLDTSSGSCVKTSDIVAPQFTVLGEKTETHEQTDGVNWVDEGVSCYDNVDGDITANITVSGSVVDLNTIGTYVVDYSCADAAGNTATASRTINVVAPTKCTIWHDCNGAASSVGGTRPDCTCTDCTDGYSGEKCEIAPGY